MYYVLTKWIDLPYLLENADAVLPTTSTDDVSIKSMNPGYLNSRIWERGKSLYSQVVILESTIYGHKQYVLKKMQTNN